MTTIALLAMFLTLMVGLTMTGRLVEAHGSPRLIILHALSSMAVLGAGLLLSLAATVDPSSLPSGDLPAHVERCIGEAVALFRHPIWQWPTMVAAVLLVAAFARLAWVGIWGLLDARRERQRVDRLASLSPRKRLTHDAVVVSDQRPFAFTSGLFSPRVVVSRGLLDLLGDDEVRAVMAHERAHVRGAHVALLSLGKMVAKAFPFVRPLRASAEMLLAGLEMSADARAARELGDPIVVARAIVAIAERGRIELPDALGAAQGDISQRVERLLEERTNPPYKVAARSATVLVGVVAIVVLLAIPMSARALASHAGQGQAHAMCHLPDGAGVN